MEAVTDSPITEDAQSSLVLHDKAKLEDIVDKKQIVDNWLKQTDFDETSSIADSTIYSSSIVSSEELADDLEKATISTPSPSEISKLITRQSDPSIRAELGLLQQMFNANNNVQNMGNVQIENCKDVIVGSVTYVTGPIHITQTKGGNVGVINQTIIKTAHPSETGTGRPSGERRHNFKATPLGEEDSDEEEEINRPDLFIGNIERAMDETVLRIVDRRTWLAQKPFEPYKYIQGPVPYVVISHTATETPLTQADSIYLVRNIQCFHIESRHWNDISYNFLVGGCGNVFEGRGWGAAGVHTPGYNKKSVGISFIGCFMSELPPSVSLEACKLLIKRGVDLGYISPDYQLIAHCQCSATESPGKQLFEEIKTWPHFSSRPQDTSTRESKGD